MADHEPKISNVDNARNSIQLQACIHGLRERDTPWVTAREPHRSRSLWLRSSKDKAVVRERYGMKTIEMNRWRWSYFRLSHSKVDACGWLTTQTFRLLTSCSECPGEKHHYPPLAQLCRWFCLTFDYTGLVAAPEACFRNARPSRVNVQCSRILSHSSRSSIPVAILDVGFRANWLSIHKISGRCRRYCHQDLLLPRTRVLWQ